MKYYCDPRAYDPFYANPAAMDNMKEELNPGSKPKIDAETIRSAESKIKKLDETILLEAYNVLEDYCTKLNAFFENVVEIHEDLDDEIDDDDFSFVPHDTLVKINRKDEEVMHPSLDLFVKFKKA